MVIIGLYVNDLLQAGDSGFQYQCSITHKRFEASGEKPLSFTFAGFNMHHSPDEPLSIHQAFHLKKLEEMVRQSSEFSDFRSMRMKIAWMSNTRPDLQLEISQLAQITQQHFDDNANVCIKKLNDAVRNASKNIASRLFPKLDKQTVPIFGYSDSALA